MKNGFCFLGLLVLLTGCGDSDVHPAEALGVYPALNESPPPPLLPVSDSPGQSSTSQASPPVEVINRDGWEHRQSEMADQVRRLREYAAKAKPGDPFALTEKQIEEFSKRDDAKIY